MIGDVALGDPDKAYQVQLVLFSFYEAFPSDSV